MFDKFVAELNKMKEKIEGHLMLCKLQKVFADQFVTLR